MSVIIAIATSLLIGGCVAKSTQAPQPAPTTKETIVASTTVATTEVKETTKAKETKATKAVKETTAKVETKATEATTEAVTRCDRYYDAVKVLEDTKSTMIKSYGKEYLDSAQWKVFEDSYWKGFWEAHKDCKICK